jgi:hypothetical protein
VPNHEDPGHPTGVFSIPVTGGVIDARAGAYAGPRRVGSRQGDGRVQVMKAAIASIVLLVAALVAYTLLGSLSFVRSVITTGPDGLRTFTIGRASDGGEILCNTGKPIPPLTGTPDGQAGAPDPVWLLAADGRRLVVVWPAGFSVRFDPAARLFNDLGESVAREGDNLELGVRTTDATGTHGDPYIAGGIEFGRCYSYVP